MATVRDLSLSDFDTAVASAQVALIDFWAPWCGPCRMTAPHVEAVAEKMAGQASFFKVNIDDNPELARRFGVTSIPTLVVVKAGQEIDRMIGARSRGEIESAVRARL